MIMSPAVDDAPLVRDDSGRPFSDDVMIRHKPTRGQQARRGFRILLILLLGLLLAAAVVVLVLLLVMVGGEPPRVVLDCGILQGTVDIQQHVYSFKGVPYAVPPTGHLRWQPPKPLNSTNCWQGINVADQFGPQCPQIPPGGEFVGDEDCLYLNVYTPSIDSTRLLPVMVYLHGGYMLFGNSSMEGYAPSAKLANKLKVVFVSVQFRLNALGFLVLDELPGSGNYGFLDQIEALKWVQTNIVQFGGDPNQVTVFGQSSGGTSVWALMVSPLAKGLFHKAWMLSGSSMFNATLAEAKVKNTVFLNYTHCYNKSMDCLMGLSAKQVVEAANKMYEFHVDDCMDLPTKGVLNLPIAIVDGKVIPKKPFDMWKEKNGNYSDVPFMIGTTAQEVDQHPAPGEDLITWDPASYEKYVSDRLNTFAPEISKDAIAMYNSTEVFNPEYQFTTMASDIRVTCGNNELAQKAAEALENNVYRYVVTSIPSSPVHGFHDSFPARYSLHGWDVFAFFGIEVFLSGAPQESDNKFVQLLTDNVMSFVKYGKPEDDRWQSVQNTTALLSDTIDFPDHGIYHKEQCNFWDEKGFYEYSWIN